MVRFLDKNEHILSCSQLGRNDGEPLFYFHGMPGSSIESNPASQIADQCGIRLIAIDRPGYGESDRQPSLHLSNWGGVVSQLADSLELEQFSVLGFSGGGPYALACANELSARVKQVFLVGSLAPFETSAMQVHINADFKPLYELARDSRELASEQISLMAETPEILMGIMQTALPAPDQAIFERVEFRKDYLRNLSRALLSGVDGLVDDMHRVTKPWEFELTDIKTPVDIWHGREDRNVGLAIAEYLAATLPNTTAHFLDACGHFLLFSQWEEILGLVKLRAEKLDE